MAMQFTSSREERRSRVQPLKVDGGADADLSSYRIIKNNPKHKKKNTIILKDLLPDISTRAVTMPTPTPPPHEAHTDSF